MKLKRQPDDFQVEELPTVAPGDRGRYRFYRLTKAGLGTIEAIEAIRRRWNLAGPQIQYGGLKDRHARTIQYLTIADGPARSLREENYALEPLGLLPHPYGPAHFRGNRFVVVLRDLGRESADAAIRAAAELANDGLPNYFDDQRFGSVGPAGDFIARAWLRGDHERALRLAIAEPTDSDRPDLRAEKALARDHWGDWTALKAALDRSHTRSLATYLVDHPDDHRGAFARLRRELRSLYFSAYQSYVWNLALSRLIEGRTRPDQRVAVAFKTATLPIHRGLDANQAAALHTTRLALPSSRNSEPAGEAGTAFAAVLGAEGLAWNDFRVKHLKDVFFSKGDRAATFRPEALAWSSHADELYPKRRKVELRFDLPRGAYATLVVKRLTVAAQLSP